MPMISEFDEVELSTEEAYLEKGEPGHIQ